MHICTRRFTLCGLATLSLLVGCSGQSGLTRLGDNDGQWTVVQPYHHPLAGVGGGAILGSVLVPESRETAIASGVLVLALQEQQLSVAKPELGLDGTIPPRTKWATDIAPISAEVIAAYNQKVPLLPLRPAIYGIAYDGEHDTAGNTFRYKISARLHEKGAISNWSPVSDDRYSGQFFVQRLAEAIKSRLQGDSSPRR